MEHEDGKKSSDELYTAMKDLVFEEFKLPWNTDDVKNVIRVADREGSRIIVEEKHAEELKARNDQARAAIAEGGATRQATNQIKAQYKPVLDEFNAYKPTVHGPLALAQLALHRELLLMRERGKKSALEAKAEEKVARAKARAERKAEERKLKAKERAEKAANRQAAKEEAARKRKEANDATHAINMRRAAELSELRLGEFKTKSETAKAMRDVAFLSRRVLMDITNEKEAGERKRKRIEEEEDEEKHPDPNAPM